MKPCFNKSKMNDTQSLVNFWSSLISEKGLAPHVENIMQIEDIEERGISLMSRVSFLWFMGLKYEKDGLENTLHKIIGVLQEKSSSICGSCLDIKKLIGDVFQHEALENGEMTYEKNLGPAKNTTLEVSVEQKENFNFQKPSKIRKVLAPDSECMVKNKINSPIVNSKVIPETNHEELSDENADFFDTPQNNSPVLGKQSKFNGSPKSRANRVLFSGCSSVLGSKELMSPPKTSKNSLPNSPSLLQFESLTPEISQSIIPNLDQNLKLPFSNSFEIIDERNSSKDKLAGSCSSHSSHATKEAEVYEASPTQIDKKGNSPKRLNHQKLLQSRAQHANKLKALNALKDSKINVEVSLDTNSKTDHKKYKQTKITKDCFLKKIQVDSVTEGKINCNEKEKDDYSKIIEKTIATKQVQDMMWKKHKELERENPPKLPKNTNSSFSPIEKTFPSTAKLKEKPLTSSKQSCFTEDEILCQMKKESEMAARTSKLSLRRKKPLFDDSFDVLPAQKKDQKGFAFRGEVVRKKSDRKQLEGWECLECKNYFASRGLTEAERKDVMNKCSRHRSKHTAVTNTPEGFWKVGWSDDDE